MSQEQQDLVAESRTHEKKAISMTGWPFLLLALALLGFAGKRFYDAVIVGGFEGMPTDFIVLVVLGILVLKGLFTLQPNQAAVTSFFGAYTGTVHGSGLRWTIPFFRKRKISLRSHNRITPTMKVNDLRGNPIEIAAAIVWRVRDTAQASYDVEAYKQFVEVQSESAVRRLASIYAYDNHDDDGEVTLREGGETITNSLRSELQDRLSQAGILVEEARVTHLAYAPEIAQAMLRRQQAEAIIAARTKIVKGAVDIVEMAIDGLSKNKIVELDEERKAAMVSNLLVVLCGETEVTPVVNTGTLYN